MVKVIIISKNYNKKYYVLKCKALIDNYVKAMYVKKYVQLSERHLICFCKK